MDIMTKIDDKHVPLYRIMWISELPHFCGNEDCDKEGMYEVRLEQAETLWGNQTERDNALAALEAWQGGLGSGNEEF